VATVSLTIVNHAPVAVNATYTADENTPLTVSTPGLMANCTDADGDTLTTGLVNGAAHGTVSVNANGSLTYTPTTGYTGADSFTYKANDGTADSTAATVSLTVLGNVSSQVSIWQTPFGRDSSPGMWSATLTVTNTSSSAINGPVQVLFTNLASGVAMTNNDGTYQNSPYITVTTGTLTPGANASVVVQVYNPARVDVTYTPVTYSGGLASVNHAPVAGNTGYTMDKNNTLTAAAPGLLANCFDADDDSLTAALVTGPAHGTLTLNANGSFTYTPATGYYGTDSFTYKANDGRADSNVATVSLAVLNVTNVTNQVSVWQTNFGRDSAPGMWSATLTVTNISSAALTGPIQVLLTDLAQGVTMVNNDGTFQDSPYITVTVNNLAPNASASVVLQVYDPTRTDVTCIAIIYSGGLPT
jgi:VCBS repeat-containing protein